MFASGNEQPGRDADDAVQAAALVEVALSLRISGDLERALKLGHQSLEAASEKSLVVTTVVQMASMLKRYSLLVLALTGGFAVPEGFAQDMGDLLRYGAMLPLRLRPSCQDFPCGEELQRGASRRSAPRCAGARRGISSTT